MARIRHLSPEFFLDEDLAALPPFARLLFAGLWTLADREGRLEDRPKRIGALLFPYDDVDVAALLDMLAGKFIRRYQVGGKRLILIRNFAKYQHPHPKESSSELPAPPEESMHEASMAMHEASKPSLANPSADETGNSGTSRAGSSDLSGSSGSSGSSESSPSGEPAAAGKAKRVKADPGYSAAFVAFWAAYPRKVSKDDAWKSWPKVARDNGGEQALLDAVLAALAWQSTLAKWRENGGEFVPYPASYLNAGRWKDERPGAYRAPSQAVQQQGPKRCQFHDDPSAQIRERLRNRLPPDGRARPSCPDCKHAEAFNRPREGGQATGADILGELFPDRGLS